MRPKILFLFIAIIQMAINCRNPKRISKGDIGFVQDTATSKVPNSSVLLDISKGKKLLEDCSGSELEQKIDTFWSPNSHDYLDLELNFFKLNTQISNLNYYIIQYIGIIFKGSKYIYINAFYKDFLKDAAGIYPELSSSPVVACGGGGGFWRVLYDVNLKEFTEVKFNAPK